ATAGGSSARSARPTACPRTKRSSSSPPGARRCAKSIRCARPSSIRTPGDAFRAPPAGTLAPGRAARQDGRPQEVLRMRIKGQADIEIFITDSGYICLKQQRDVDGEQLIELAPAYGAKVADAIGSLQEVAHAKFEKTALIVD